MAPGAERLAQAADVDIHGMLFHEHPASPDIVQQLFPAVHPVGATDKEMQQTELGGREVEGLAVCLHPVADRIQ